MSFQGLLLTGPPNSPVSIKLLFCPCRIICIVYDELAKMKVAVRIQFGKFNGKVPVPGAHGPPQGFNGNLVIKGP